MRGHKNIGTFELSIIIKVTKITQQKDKTQQKVKFKMKKNHHIKRILFTLLLITMASLQIMAQMALPISASMKGVLWFILFGMAKTFQYGGLTILGVEGVKRLKNWWQSKA